MELKLIETAAEKKFAPLKYIFDKLDIDALPEQPILGYIKEKKGIIAIEILENEEIIELTRCKSVEIYYVGYKGELSYKSDEPRWEVSLGDRNILKIEINNTETRYNILLNSRKDKNRLKEFITKCYECKVQLKEYYRGIRTYKWDKVNYQTIQEIKEKHGLKEW